MSKLAKAATWLMLATLLTKILGFGREMALSYVYGTNAISEAFVVAFSIPTIIFAAAGSAIATTYIPIYYEVENEIGKKATLKFTNNIVNVIVIICTILSILGIIFTEPLVKLFAIGFDGERLKLTVQYTRILIMSIPFIGLSFIMNGYLQVHNNFTVPGLGSLPKNIIIIVSIFLSAKYNSVIIAIGTLLGIASEFLFQVPFAAKNGYKYKPFLDLKDAKMKKLVILIAPIFVGIAVNQINTMVDKSLASTLPLGSVAALNFASKLNSFVISIFIVSITAVVYPLISRLSVENSKEDFAQVVVRSVNSITLLVLPVSVGAIVLSQPIVRLLFERGEFTAQDTKITAVALSFYAIGLIGSGLNDILTKIFYALKDTKTPMKSAILAVVINICLNFALIKYLKHAGLAFATSIANISIVIVLFIALKKKIKDFGQRKIIITFIKSLVASLIMGFAAYMSNKYLAMHLSSDTIGQVISLGTSVLVGAIVYGVLVILFKISEITYIIDMVKAKLKLKK